jgi:hypothetical protein
VMKSSTGGEAVALAGDWHGNIPWAMRMVAAAHDAGVRVIVQLGDFGYWRDDPSTRKYLRRLERLLGELDMTLYWVDGNHEDHVRLLKHPLAADETRPISDHVVHPPRGFRWTWRDGDGIDRTWLALGGAVSMDRVYRTPGRSWWPEEEITPTDVSVAIAGGLVDVLDHLSQPITVSGGLVTPRGFAKRRCRDLLWELSGVCKPKSRQSGSRSTLGWSRRSTRRR